MLFETSELFKAIKDKTLETPSKTLEIINSEKEDVNYRSRKEESYLHFIAHSYGREEDEPFLIPVVFQLSNAGIDVNAQDINGNTALHIAAKSPEGRKLIRALLIVGCDPETENNDKQTAAKLAKQLPNNLKLLNLLSPGLWRSVEGERADHVLHLLSNWVKIDQTKDEVKLLDIAEQSEMDVMKKALKMRENTVKFVHYALAGDRQRLRPFFKMKDVNVNTLSISYVDVASGELISCPLVAEVAILGLAAVLRKLLRKKVAVESEIKGTPLYMYVMQHMQPEPCFYEVLEMLIYEHDFKKDKEHFNAIADLVYEKKVPLKVLRIMAANGLDLFLPDMNGHFLRDRILIKNVMENPRVIQTELEYVDNIVIDMAENGCLDLLQELLERGYDHLDVTDSEGRSVNDGLWRSKGPGISGPFMMDVEVLHKLYRDICNIVVTGHLEKVQDMVTKKVTRIKDKFGRPLLFKAVMFERRHMLRFLLKLCPEMAKCVDKKGRTALHIACAQEESEDIEALLKSAGLSMDDEDNDGLTPYDVKAMNIKDKATLLETERTRDLGIDTYLYFRYLDIKEAIRKNDLSKVEDIRSKMYRDIETKDITSLMVQTSPPQKCLLQFALEAKRDAIGKYLLTQGLDWDVKYKIGKTEQSVLEIAQAAELKAVINYVEYQISENEKQNAQIKKLKVKGVVKNQVKAQKSQQPPVADTTSASGSAKDTSGPKKSGSDESEPKGPPENGDMDKDDFEDETETEGTSKSCSVQ